MSPPTEITREQVRARRGRAAYQRVGLLLGPALAAVLLLLPPPGELGAAGWRTAALGLWMAIWWATEALPVAATALLPIALFPLFGIADIGTVTAPFANPIIYLFLGGFLVALAMQRCGLHQRVALAMVARFGGSGTAIVGGFMLASAVVSMWVTNTATTMMLLPIAVSVVGVVRESLGGGAMSAGAASLETASLEAAPPETAPSETAGTPGGGAPPAAVGISAPREDPHETRAIHERFPKAMLLGLAYGATIGGLATLIGTPPNALLAAFMLERYGVEIGFAQWMLVGVPLAAVLLPLCWWLLAWRLYPVRFSTGGAAREHLAGLRRGLGPIRPSERRVAAVAAALALGWIARPLLARFPGLDGLSDAGLAMLAALALFLLPAGSDEPSNSGPRRLLAWADTRELPWGVLLLFGGGLALAAAVSSTGLAEWMGQRLLALGLTELAVIVVLVAALIIFLTELTSNTATAAAFLPVAAAVAAEAGFSPIALTAPVALAASCAFMLPVATPPNAVVFSSGLLSVPDMVRAGVWMNLIGILLVSLVALLLAPLVLG